MLVSLNNINKIYNGKQILTNISLTVDENDKIGLVGNNGCGKSTLLKILTGAVEPDRFNEKDGIISFAAKTTIGYLEQMGGLDSENTVMEEMNKVFEHIHKAIERLRDIELEIQLGDNSSADEYQQLSSWLEANDGYNTDVKIRTVLNGMGFSGEQLNRRVSGFSGGEKTRLCISRLLLEEPNLLILDEPTNHLDFKTIMWLEDYLRSYRGAVLIVSHDRYFLDRLCTSICEIATIPHLCASVRKIPRAVKRNTSSSRSKSPKWRTMWREISSALLPRKWRRADVNSLKKLSA